MPQLPAGATNAIFMGITGWIVMYFPDLWWTAGALWAVGLIGRWAQERSAPGSMPVGAQGATAPEQRSMLRRVVWG